MVSKRKFAELEERVDALCSVVHGMQARISELQLGPQQTELSWEQREAIVVARQEERRLKREQLTIKEKDSG